MKRFSFFILFLVVTSFSFAEAADAQSIVNPTAVEYNSPDHNLLDGAGQPILTDYIIEYYLSSGSTNPITQSIFNRSLVVPGTVTATCPNPCLRINFSALPSYPIGVDLKTKIRAKGNSGISGPSNLSAETFNKPAPVPAVPQGVRVVP